MLRKFTVCLAAIFMCAPALAHHNYRANFDDSTDISLHGVITNISWANPHITIHLEVRLDNGDVAKWTLPTAAPNVARRNGLTAAVLDAGDEVTVVGWPARDKSLQMRARLLVKADGTEYLLHPTR